MYVPLKPDLNPNMASEPSQISWIGLGNMGRGMVKNLASKGPLSHPLIIHNRTVSKAESLKSSLSEQGITNLSIAPTISDAIRPASIIFTCLGDDLAMKSTLDDILSNNDIKGKLIVDCSTIHPSTTSFLSSTIISHGGSFVACPVFGAPPMAEAGQLVCVLAGPADAVERVKPYTKGVISRANIDFSDQPAGKATQLKLIGNTFILNMVETLSEGHVLAEKSGLGTENLHGFIETMFPGPYTAYSTRMLQGDYYKREEPAFGVDLARKDARHALDLAKEAGVRMKGVEVADGHLADVQKRMGSKGDIAGIYGAVRQEAGLGFEI